MYILLQSIISSTGKDTGGTGQFHTQVVMEGISVAFLGENLAVLMRMYHVHWLHFYPQKYSYTCERADVQTSMVVLL